MRSRWWEGLGAVGVGAMGVVLGVVIGWAAFTPGSEPTIHTGRSANSGATAVGGWSDDVRVGSSLGDAGRNVAPGLDDAQRAALREEIRASIRSELEPEVGATAPAPGRVASSSPSLDQLRAQYGDLERPGDLLTDQQRSLVDRAITRRRWSARERAGLQSALLGASREQRLILMGQIAEAMERGDIRPTGGGIL